MIPLADEPIPLNAWDELREFMATLQWDNHVSRLLRSSGGYLGLFTVERQPSDLRNSLSRPSSDAARWPEPYERHEIEDSDDTVRFSAGISHGVD